MEGPKSDHKGPTDFQVHPPFRQDTNRLTDYSYQTLGQPATHDSGQWAQSKTIDKGRKFGRFDRGLAVDGECVLPGCWDRLWWWGCPILSNLL